MNTSAYMPSTVIHIQKGEKTMTAKEAMNPYRTTARIVGVLYLAGFVVGIGGRRSSNPFLIRRIT